MNTKPIPTRSTLGAIALGLQNMASAVSVALLNLMAIVWLVCDWALQSVQSRVDDDFDESRSAVWFAVVAAGAVVSVICIADLWPQVIAWLGIDTTACTSVNPCH